MKTFANASVSPQWTNERASKLVTIQSIPWVHTRCTRRLQRRHWRSSVFQEEAYWENRQTTSVWWYGKNESPKPHVPRCRRLHEYDQQRNRLLPIVIWKAAVLCMVDGNRLSLQLERVTLKLENKDKFSFWILSGYFHFGTHLAPYAIKQSRSISPSLKPPSLVRKKAQTQF